MNKDYSFRAIQDEKEVALLETFLRAQPWNYPHYQDWVSRAKEELLSEYKTAILAFNDQHLIGDLVFQPHKDFAKTMMEIKNLRVSWKERGRGIAEFLVKQLEVEAKRKGYKALIGDTRTDNYPVIHLMGTLGFQELARTHLYEDKAQDIVYFKTLGKENSFRPVAVT